MPNLDTGLTLPTTGQSLGIGVAWNIPGGLANESQDTYRSSSGVSAELTGTNYGFSIPTEATILGIELRIRRSDTGAGTASDNTVRLKKSTGIVGDNKAVGGSYGAESEVTYGGATDLWGTTWTPAEVNHSGFGALLKANKPSTSGDTYVWYFKIKVYYSVPGGGSGFMAAEIDMLN